MVPLTCKKTVGSPSHTVECSGVCQFAYTFSKADQTFSKSSWSADSEDDQKEIDATNAKLPQNCEMLETLFSAKLGKKLAEFYLGKDFIVGFEDEVFFPSPDSIFLQRVSPFTKTFDMVCFYGKKYIIFNIVDRKDLQDIRDWYPNKIYSCTADPLPFHFVDEFMRDTDSKTPYKDLFDLLFNQVESSCSEYEQSEESDEEYESDDVYESSEHSESEDEYESDNDSNSDDEYKPQDDDPEDDRDKKKRKMF